MNKPIPTQVYVLGGLTAVTVVAPMFGMAGLAIALATSCILITVMFHLAFQGMSQQTHVHYHYKGQEPQPQPYTEGTERKALLPNGTQVQERTIRRYNQ